MTRAELAEAISARANVSRAETEAILDALAAIAHERLTTPESLFAPKMAAAAAPAPGEAARGCPPDAGAYVPRAGEIEALLEAARRHPLGTEFLLGGQLGAVAAMFHTHAFTIEAARRMIREHGVVA